VDAGEVRTGAALEVQGLVKSFGGTQVLKGIELAVRAGELLVVLGPSGSGKTTLLQLIAGYELPDAGAVRLGGSDVTFADPSRRDIGMVFQSYALFPHLTVAQNVAFPLRMRRLAQREIAERVAWALGLVDLAGFGSRYPRQLSGGQQQRVALARAVVFGPRLLLLDEPFGALDRKLRDAMQVELRRLQRALAVTTVFITHDQDEALILGDRIAVLREGTLQQVAPPGELYRTPANRFVADFIGESNLLTGVVIEAANGESVVDCSSVRIAVRCGDEQARGAPVDVLLRPEAIRLAALGKRPRNVVEGTVTERIFLGNAYRYRIAVAGDLELLVRVPSMPGERLPAPGERAQFGWDAEDTHLIVAR
jgi:putative spermidine/putrescine transport system ATP-binding protein